MTERSEVTDYISNLAVGEAIDVILHRFSNNTQHFICYPSNIDYEGKEDGVHLDTSESLTTDLSTLVEYDEVIVHGRIEITEIKTNGYPLANLKSLENISLKDDDSSIQQVSDILELIDDSESISINGELSVEFPISWKAKKEAEEEAESTGSTPESGEEDRKFPPISDPNKSRLYYVDTSNAECYHSTRHCSGLRKREGDIQAVVKENEKPLPEPISDLRKCHLC